eukprot:583316-Pelagomonas_calceolata.AAC.1
MGAESETGASLLSSSCAIIGSRWVAFPGIGCTKIAAGWLWCQAKEPAWLSSTHGIISKSPVSNISRDVFRDFYGLFLKLFSTAAASTSYSKHSTKHYLLLFLKSKLHQCSRPAALAGGYSNGFLPTYLPTYPMVLLEKLRKRLTPQALY